MLELLVKNDFRATQPWALMYCAREPSDAGMVIEDAEARESKDYFLVGYVPTPVDYALAVHKCLHSTG